MSDNGDDGEPVSDAMIQDVLERLTLMKDTLEKTLDGMDPEEAFKYIVSYCAGESLNIITLRVCLSVCGDEIFRAHGASDTLLHHACANERVDLEMVEHLIDNYPEAVRHVSYDGCLPLHRACGNSSCPNDVVELLLAEFPEGIAVSSGIDGLPLHHLVRRSAYRYHEVSYGDITGSTEEKECPDRQVIEHLLDAHPEALTNQSNDLRQTPLLYACDWEIISLEMIELLAGGDLAAMSLQGGVYRLLPIQRLFCNQGRSKFTDDVVEFFLKNSPDEALDRFDQDGNTPFHAACCSPRVSLEVIQLLLKQRPDLMEQFDKRDSFSGGNLPLHSFCRNNEIKGSEYMGILRFLVEANPVALKTRNAQGELPLHIACYGSLPRSLPHSRSLEAIRLLVEYYPESAHQVNSQRCYPLHLACRYGEFEVVKYLFEMYPDAITFQTRLSSLPLHEACSSGDSDKVLFLMDKYPDALRVLGSFRDFPFHRLCDSPCSDLSTFRQMFDVFPGAMFSKNFEGHFPLHCLAHASVHNRMDVVQFVVSQDLNAIRELDRSGRSIVHLSCSRDCRHHSLRSPDSDIWLQDLKCVIQLCPDGVRVNSPDHGLPIHVACSSNLNLEVIKFLESCYPQSLDVYNQSVGLPLECTKDDTVFEYLIAKRYNGFFREHGVLPMHAVLNDDGLKDKKEVVEHTFWNFGKHASDIDRNGASPLHLAVKEVPDVDFIESLVLDFPTAVELQDSKGRLPIHNALCAQPSHELVKLLLTDWTAAVADHDGSIPLHVATRHNVSNAAISLILEIHPEGGRAVDALGRLPLHLACSYGTCVATVRLLVENNEAGLRLRDESGDLPLHQACRGGYGPSVQYLLSRDMPLALERDASGMLPVFILAQSDGKSRDILDSPAYVEALWKLLLAQPESIMSGLH